MKKILVIDDHPAVMEGTKTILETDTNLSVDCLSPDASEQFVLRHDFSAYDLILMDLNLRHRAFQENLKRESSL